MSLTIKDRLEIQDLIVRYAYAKDLGDESDLLSIFTDAPVLESGVTGRRTGVEVLRDMARRDQEKRKTYRLRHAVYGPGGASDAQELTAETQEVLRTLMGGLAEERNGDAA